MAVSTNTKLLIVDIDDTKWTRKNITPKNWKVVADVYGMDYAELMKFQPGRTVTDVFKRYADQLSSPNVNDLPDGVASPPPYVGDGEDFKRVAEWYTTQLDQNIAPDADIPILPGAQERIMEAEAAGIRVAIVTSADSVTFTKALVAAKQTPQARAAYPELGERGFRFPPNTILVSGDRLEGGPGKPHPHALRLAMSKAGIADPSEVQMWGDSWSDVLAGLLAGVETLAIGTGTADKLTSWNLTKEGIREVAEKKGLDHLLPESAPLPVYVNDLQEVSIGRSTDGTPVIKRGVQPLQTAEMSL